MPELRQALREDIPAIQRIRMAVRENRLVSRVIADAEVIDAIEQRGRGWVVLEAEDIVGFGIALREERNIWALFIDPEFEGRGHGRRLLEAMCDWLWSLGDAPLWLSTDPGTRAEAFYEKAGWRRAGRLANGEVKFEKSAP